MKTLLVGLKGREGGRWKIGERKGCPVRGVWRERVRVYAVCPEKKVG